MTSQAALDGERRQHQETSPSQMAGPHADRVGKGPANSWNFLEFQGGIPDCRRNTLVKGIPYLTSMPT